MANTVELNQTQAEISRKMELYVQRYSVFIMHLVLAIFKMIIICLFNEI